MNYNPGKGNLVNTSTNQTIGGTKNFINLSIPSGAIISGINSYYMFPTDNQTTGASSTVVSFFLESGKIYRCENFFRFTPGGANSFSDVLKTPALSVYADGYRQSFNNQTTAGGGPLSGNLVAGFDNGNGSFWGPLSGTNNHVRKAILRPSQDARITFTYGSHNGAATTFVSGSFVLLEKIGVQN